MDLGNITMDLGSTSTSNITICAVHWDSDDLEEVVDKSCGKVQNSVFDGITWMCGRAALDRDRTPVSIHNTN